MDSAVGAVFSYFGWTSGSQVLHRKHSNKTEDSCCGQPDTGAQSCPAAVRQGDGCVAAQPVRTPPAAQPALKLATAGTAATGQLAHAGEAGCCGRQEQDAPHVTQAEDFQHLAGRVYLDHAGATLYSQRQLREAFQTLQSGLYTNPHSQPGAGSPCAAAEQEARRLTLQLCNAAAEQYEVVFTSGATAALHLVAQAFDWREGGVFAYTRDNHTSVLGIRELALAAGASAVAVVALRDPTGGGWQLVPCAPAMRRPACAAQGAAPGSGWPRAPSLFAFPLESNFSGVRHDPALVQAAQRGGVPAQGPGGGRVYVLLDAAKACATQPPDLAQHPADFVVLSYYKLFGYPTGLGALLVRKDALPQLGRKAYFGGGAVAAAAADEDFLRRREGAAGLVDGTPTFLAIAALPAGFRALQRAGGLPAIHRRTIALTRHLATEMAGLRHGNGQPLCMLYGAHDVPSGVPASGAAGQRTAPWAAGQGPVVTFNLLRPDGSLVGYGEVGRLAGLAGILLRTGCCCNPGACAWHLALSPGDVRGHYQAGHVCWDDHDLIAGRPTGAVRVSFGYMSTMQDVNAFLLFVKQYFLQQRDSPSLLVAAAPRSPVQPISPTDSDCQLTTPHQHPPAQSAAKGDTVACSRPSDAADPPVSPCPAPASGLPAQQAGRLRAIWLYPVKSCAGVEVEAWPLGPQGLLLDREWALVGPDGAVLTQRSQPGLALVQPRLDLARAALHLSHPDLPHQLTLHLPDCVVTGPAQHKAGAAVRKDARQVTTVQLCASSVSSLQGGSDDEASKVAAWFERALGVACRLVQQRPGSRHMQRHGPLHKRPPPGNASEGEHAPPLGLGFANEGQLLLVNEASVGDLARRVAARCAGTGGPALDLGLTRFRANLAVAGLPAYAEDAWRAVSLGGERLQVAGPCSRCEMVCVDQTTARRTGAEPLLTLAAYRRQRGRINFGLLLSHPSDATATHGSVAVKDMTTAMPATAGRSPAASASKSLLPSHSCHHFPVLEVGMQVLPEV